MTEQDLIRKLLRIEALRAGATTPGEQEAASQAAERIRARLAELARQEPAVEYTFTLHDPWTRQLFIALCRRYGLRPFRYPRQKRQTVVVKVPGRFVDETLWPHFEELSEALRSHLQEITDRVIQEAVHAEFEADGERQRDLFE